ncbi:MAG: GDSL-type esterase/lipase family protein [Planctomycetota bacterium]|nr:GDSL-type esterase/lipase family protein [Planctomycetota bacterium]
MKRVLLRAGDLLVGIPLALLSMWPIRLRRKIAGPRDRGPALARGVVSILFLLVYYVVVFELVARGVQLARNKPTTPPWRYVDDSFLYERHAFRGFGMIPNAQVRKGVAGFSRDDFRILVNEHGCRGPALDPPGSGRPRVLCFGGSVTFGTGVDHDAAWPARLAALAPEWSVMNCGVSGYMSAHILAFLQGALFDLEPDLVIVYTGRNDMHMNESFQGAAFQSDYQHAHGNDRRPTGLSRWFIHNTFLGCTVARWNQSVRNALGRTMRRRGAPVADMGPRGRAAFRRNIDDLLALAKRRDIPVLLASEAPGYEPLTLADGSRNPHLDHLAKDAAGCPPAVYTRGLEAYGDTLRATGAPYVDTARELRRDPWLYVDSIHLSRAGAQEVAKMLLPAARKLIR